MSLLINGHCNAWQEREQGSVKEAVKKIITLGVVWPILDKSNRYITRELIILL